MKPIFLQIILDTPLDRLFDYRWCLSDDSESVPQIGQLALVPFGTRNIVGMIVGIKNTTDIAEDKIRDAIAIRDQLTPLSAEWIALCTFAANYYHRGLGEVVLPSLPKNLRLEKTTSLERNIKKLEKRKHVSGDELGVKPVLNAEQSVAVNSIVSSSGFAPFLLHGVTGSGKTEVYLQTTEKILSQAKAKQEVIQILMMVPEINLTPQLEHHIRQRFPDTEVVSLHSGLAEGERLQNWLLAHTGRAQIVLGTRLSILASMPQLKLIIVDEEHDPSYKQQEGLRYSARDLAIWRAHQLQIPIVLGSATPSLETWQHALSGHYTCLKLTERAVQHAIMPRVKLINLEQEKPHEGLTNTLIEAIRQRIEKQEQTLLYINRRGYAPVLSCDACGWISHCTRCSSYMVLHKSEHLLRCHHCGLEQRIPHACPDCGNIDLQPLGRGTQRIEETLQGLFPEARLLRIDADSTKRKGTAQLAFEQVHKGEVDILIGTQMVSKGHDFQRLTLVGVLNADNALFSHDYRASERLFAQLMQVAGRAGRAGQKAGGNPGEVYIQTRYPHHPLYQALSYYDYDGFAQILLEEREQAALPPFVYQAMLRAEAKEMDQAIAFLKEAAQLLVCEGIEIHDPVPMTMARIAHVDRAQLLIECASRPLLQQYLTEWMKILLTLKTRVKWFLEVDPASI